MRKENKKQIRERGQQPFDFEKRVGRNLKTALDRFKEVLVMPEKTPEEIERKQNAHANLMESPEIYDLHVIADIQVAQVLYSQDKRKHKQNHNR